MIADIVAAFVAHSCRSGAEFRVDLHAAAIRTGFLDSRNSVRSTGTMQMFWFERAL